MKMLVIMKRFGANKDMVTQNAGRQVKIFEALSKFGYKIDFFCLDYKKHENRNIKKRNINYLIRPYSIFKYYKLTDELKKIINKNKYDYIVGSTDPLLGILGFKLAKKFNVRYIYDMQDEYSAYASYRIPFVRHWDKKAVKNSDIVLTVSDSLNSYIRKFREKPTYTIQNGFDLKERRKIGKSRARKILNLPQGKIIIYIGEISRFKGVDILIEAFKQVKRTIPNSYLLLTGKVADNINIRHDSIIYKEYPKREELIAALNAADIAVLPNKKSMFSRFSFPYKLADYMAAGLPIVATDIGDASFAMSKYKNSICKLDDKFDMADKIIKKLGTNGRVDYGNVLNKLSWNSLAKKLDSIIKG